MSSLTCTVHKGDLPIQISWFLNNQSAETLQGISIMRTNKRISQLSIDSVQAEHSGEFTCQARNKAGITKYSANLHVNGTLLDLFVFYWFLSPWKHPFFLFGNYFGIEKYIFFALQFQHWVSVCLNYLHSTNISLQQYQLMLGLMVINSRFYYILQLHPISHLLTLMEKQIVEIVFKYHVTLAKGISHWNYLGF